MMMMEALLPPGGAVTAEKLTIASADAKSINAGLRALGPRAPPQRWPQRRRVRTPPNFFVDKAYLVNIEGVVLPFPCVGELTPATLKGSLFRYCLEEAIRQEYLRVLAQWAAVFLHFMGMERWNRRPAEVSVWVNRLLELKLPRVVFSLNRAGARGGAALPAQREG
jgi:hypothetical protein